MANKSNLVGFRLTDDEKQVLDCLCADFDLTPSRLVRLALRYTQRLNREATGWETKADFAAFVNTAKTRSLLF